MTGRRGGSAVLAALGAAGLVWLGARVEAVGGRPLVWLLGDDPGVYDPQATSSPLAESVFSFACEPLVTDEPEGRLRGVLAEDGIRVSGDGRTIFLRLRPGVRFHDGTAVDAAAVAASFDRLQRLGVSPLGEDLREVTFAPGPGPLDLVVRLPRPDPEFPRLVLASPYASIVRAPEGEGEAAALPVCTGPYRFDAALYAPGREVGLDRAPGYERQAVGAGKAGPAGIQRLRFAFEPDRERRLARLLEGDGCVLSLSDSHLARVEAAGGHRLHRAVGGLTYLGFNFQRPRWQDAAARRAVARALDPAAVAAGGPFRPALTPLLPDALGYDPAAAASRPAPDPAARRLLGQAGLGAGTPIVLLTAEGETYGRLAEAVVGQLREAGLADVRVRAVPRDAIAARRQDFDLLLYDYAWRDYTALGIFLGPGPRNLLGYAEGDIARLVSEARQARDEAARSRLLLAAQERILGDALWVPLVVREITVAVKAACVGGEAEDEDGGLWWHGAWTAGGSAR